jgi:hypothetical protein
MGFIANCYPKIFEISWTCHPEFIDSLSFITSCQDLTCLREAAPAKAGQIGPNG